MLHLLRSQNSYTTEKSIHPNISSVKANTANNTYSPVTTQENKKKKLYPVELQKLKNGEDDVVDIAEPRGLALFGVVEPTSPVHGDVGVAAVELDGGADATAGGGLTEGEEAFKDGAVLPDVEALHGAGIEDVRVAGGRGKEGDVFVGVEAADVGFRGREGARELE